MVGVSICICMSLCCYCVDCSALFMMCLKECIYMFCAEDTYRTSSIWYLLDIFWCWCFVLFIPKHFSAENHLHYASVLGFTTACLIKTMQSLAVQQLNCDSAQEGSCDGSLRSENWEVFSLSRVDFLNVIVLKLYCCSLDLGGPETLSETLRAHIFHFTELLYERKRTRQGHW